MLDNTDYVVNYVVRVVTSAAGTDDVIVQVGCRASLEEDAIIKDLKDRFRSKLRVAPHVQISPIEDIQKVNFPDKSRKPIKFIDGRTH